MKVYYDKDADLSLIKGKKVTIVGYGSQGHAHALNLTDSGVKVTVGLRKGGASWSKAEKAGLKVEEVAKAVKGADVVMMLLPDENIPAVYYNDVEPNIKKGAALAFAHGFNVHYNQVVAREDLDVIMVAPKGPGHTVRSEYLKGGGVPSLIAVHQDKSGKARDIALSYAAAKQLEMVDSGEARVRLELISDTPDQMMIMEPMKVRIEGERAYLTFSLIRSNTGTVQPKDVWKMLAESFGLPWTPDAFICSRTGTYRKEAGERKTPFDPGVFDAWVKKK